MAVRRLTREFRFLESNPIDGVAIAIDEDNIKTWCITVEGHKDTPYEGHVYAFALLFSNEYPFSPPIVSIITPILHPNISHRGDICLSVLKEDWVPSNTIKKIIEQIQAILMVPNIDDPLDVRAASLYTTNYPEFVKLVRERYTTK